jgi:heptosyltransferase-2
MTQKTWIITDGLIRGSEIKRQVWTMPSLLPPPEFATMHRCGMHHSIEKVLVIRFSSVGDILLSSLLLRAFRKRFPQCRLDYLVKERYAELVLHNPHVSSVLAFPSNESFHELRKLRRTIIDTGYDLLIDIHDSLRSRYLCFGQPHVVRINKRKIARLMLIKTKLDLYRFFKGAPSIAERYLETVRSLGVGNDGEGLEMHLTMEARQKAAEMLSGAGMTNGDLSIGIAPTALHYNKMWPGEYFAEVGVSLWRTKRARIILFGSSRDREHCALVESMIKRQEADALVLNSAGRTTLTDAAALMDACAVILTNDSGLMHLATARGRNVVALFGPTVRSFGFFPYTTNAVVLENSNLSCRPCTHIGLPYCPKQHFRCMKDITPASVVAAAENLLRN